MKLTKGTIDLGYFWYTNFWTFGLQTPHPPRDAFEGKRPQRRPQRRLGKRLEAVAKAVGGGCCRLQIPWRLALGVRGTVAGHRLGALEGGEGYPPPFQCIPPPPLKQKSAQGPAYAFGELALIRGLATNCRRFTAKQRSVQQQRHQGNRVGTPRATAMSVCGGGASGPPGPSTPSPSHEGVARAGAKAGGAMVCSARARARVRAKPRTETPDTRAPLPSRALGND